MGLMGMAQVIATIAYGIRSLRRGETIGSGLTWGSRGAPFGEGTLSPLRRYLKPLPKGGRGGGGGERGTEAPLRYLKGASKASKVS